MPVTTASNFLIQQITNSITFKHDIYTTSEKLNILNTALSFVPRDTGKYGHQDITLDSDQQIQPHWFAYL